MRKYISLRSYGSSVLQLAGLRVVCGRLLLRRCSQLCMLLVCLYINNLYCNHRVLAQLLHHFCHTLVGSLVGSLPLANDFLHSASTCIGVHHILLYTCTLWADNTAYAEPMDCKSMLLLRDFISYYAGCTSYSLWSPPTNCSSSSSLIKVHEEGFSKTHKSEKTKRNEKSVTIVSCRWKWTLLDWWQKDWRTDTHARTQDNYCNPCSCMPRVNAYPISVFLTSTYRDGI